MVNQFQGKTETLHILNNIDNAIWTIWVQSEGEERFCI